MAGAADGQLPHLGDHPVSAPQVASRYACNVILPAQTGITGGGIEAGAAGAPPLNHFTMELAVGRIRGVVLQGSSPDASCPAQRKNRPPSFFQSADRLSMLPGAPKGRLRHCFWFGRGLDRPPLIGCGLSMWT